MSDDSFIRDLAVEIADVIDPPDFVSNPNRNAHSIDMVEEMLTRRLAGMHIVQDRAVQEGERYLSSPSNTTVIWVAHFADQGGRRWVVVASGPAVP